MAEKFNRLYLLINISIIISIICTIILTAVIYYCNGDYTGSGTLSMLNITTGEKNFSVIKSIAIISAVLSLFFTVLALPISISHLKVKLKCLEKEIKKLTVTDDLTSLYNRNYFIHKLNAEFERARRYNYPLSLIISNIDSLKMINEKFGLNEGDLVLKSVADIIKPLCRESDTVARYGESEFAIILPNTGEKGALVIAEKLRSNVEQYKYKKGAHPVTISLGISSMSPDSAYSAETLIYNADTALDRAKDSGKNFTVFYNPA